MPIAIGARSIVYGSLCTLHCRLSCYTALLSVVDQYWVGPACGGRGVCVCKIRIGACMCTCLWCEVCTFTKRCEYTGVRGTVE